MAEAEKASVAFRLPPWKPRYARKQNFRKPPSRLRAQIEIAKINADAKEDTWASSRPRTTVPSLPDPMQAIFETVQS